MLYSEPYPNAEIIARRDRISTDFAAANGTAGTRRRARILRRTTHRLMQPVPRSA